MPLAHYWCIRYGYFSNIIPIVVDQSQKSQAWVPHFEKHPYLTSIHIYSFPRVSEKNPPFPGLVYWQNSVWIWLNPNFCWSKSLGSSCSVPPKFHGEICLQCPRKNHPVVKPPPRPSKNIPQQKWQRSCRNHPMCVRKNPMQSMQLMYRVFIPRGAPYARCLKW